MSLARHASAIVPRIAADAPLAHRPRRADRSARVLAALGILALAAIALTACAGGPRPGPSATVLPPGVDATLVQYPADVAAGTAHVRLTNSADKVLEIGRMLITDDRVAGYGRRPAGGDIEVAAGATTDIPVLFPKMNCTDAGTSADTMLLLPYTLGASSGVSAAELSDPNGILSTLFTAACATEAAG